MTEVDNNSEYKNFYSTQLQKKATPFSNTIKIV